MLASLAMYDFDGFRDDWSALYAPIAAAIPDAPRALRWGDGAFNWSGDVFLSMTCGAPFRNDLAERLHLVGTFDFGIIAEQPAYYNSVILGTVPDNRPVRLGVNDMGSQSGYHAMVRWLRAQNLAFEIVLSGAHQRSMELLAEGEIDLCGIDAVSHRFITRGDAGLAALPVVTHSQTSPGLPLVTAYPGHIPLMRDILRKELPNRRLGIRGLIEIPRQAYLAVENAPAA